MVGTGSKAKPVRRLKSGTETTKNHRFEGFSSRISKLKIDPIHRVRRASFGEDEDETSSYFRSALDHWFEMNLSDNFTTFVRRVNPLSESFAQVVYHEEKIMGLLVEFIEKRDQLSMEPLLSLLAQFARDLGVKFEKHFATAVTLVSSVAATHSDIEVVEWSFTCLAWIFKFLSRLLVPDLRQLLGIMTPYLGKERQKPFVARFAAESMSFLIRKAGLTYYKNHAPLEIAVSYLFDDISKTADDNKDTESYREGLMNMFSDAIRGVNNGLHSNGMDILHCILRQIPPTSDNRNDPAEVVCGLIVSLVHATTPDTFGPILDTVQAYIEERSKSTPNPNLTECSRIIFLLVTTRKGVRIQNWKIVHQIHVSLLQQVSASEVSSETTTKLLTSVAYALQQSPMDELLPSLRAITDLVSTGPLSKYFLFFCTTFAEWGSERFQSLLLSPFQKFINSSWQKSESETCYTLLRLHQAGCITPEPSQPGCISCPEAFKTRINDSLKYPAKDEAYLNALVKLPTAISVFSDNATMAKMVSKLHSNLSSAFKDGAAEGNNQNKGLMFFLGQGFKTYVELANKTGKLDSNLLQPIIATATKFSRLPVFLEGAFAFITSLPESADLEHPALEAFAQDLIVNLASPSHRLRLVSLQILRELVLRIAKEDSTPVDLSIEIEQSPLTMDSVRTISMHIRKLALIYPQIAHRRWMANLVPYFCFGLFSKKLAPLWDDSAATLKTISEHPEGEKIVSNLAIQWLQERDTEAPSDPAAADDESSFVNSHFQCYNVAKVEKVLAANAKSTDSPQAVLSQQFKQDHTVAEIIPATPRTHALRVLNAAPGVAEKRSRQIVPMFLSWALRDDQDDAPSSGEAKAEHDDEDEDEEDAEAVDIGDEQVRWGFRDRLSMLTLFARFLNPIVLYRAPEVHTAILGLLCHGNSELQRHALKVLFTWKDPNVLPYQENLLNLLDESRFKDELGVFVHVGGEDSLIKNEHRDVLLPVLLRLLYGRMISKAGSAAAGQAGRRKTILRTISHLSEQDFGLFIQLAFGPLGNVHPVKENDEIDYTAFDQDLTSPKRQLGLLKLIDSVFESLQTRMTKFAPQTMDVVIYCLVRACRAISAEGTDERLVAIFQSIRQTCIRCLNLVFSIVSDRDWTPYVRIIFKEMIDSRLDQFPIETAQGVSGLLRLFHTWASFPRSTFYLVQHNDKVLTKVIDCLAVESARDEVKNFVMDEILVPLIEHSTGKKLQESEEMPDFPAEQVKSEVLSPYLEHALFHLGRLLKRGPSKPVLYSGVNALSLIAPCVENSQETASLISITTYLLRQPPDRVSPRTKSGLLKILEHFLPLWDPKEDAELSQQVFEAVCSMFDYFKDDSNREVLSRVFTALATHDEQLREVAALCEDLNSRSSKRLEPDYERRLVAFRKITDELSHTLTAKQWRPILYNMLFHVRDEDELSVRSSASFGLKRFIDRTSTEPDADFEILINDVLFPSLQYGIRQKSELIRSEIVTVIGYFVKLNPTRPSVQDMHVLLVGDDEEASFFNNILHIQQHRRQRALRRLAGDAAQGNIQASNLGSIFIPLIEHFVFEDAADENAHNLIAEGVATLGALSEWLEWGQFRANFRRYRSYMASKPEKEKNILRLLGRMSDALSSAMKRKKATIAQNNGDDGNDDNDDKMDVTEQPMCTLAKSVPSLAKVATELTTNFIPFLTKYIHHKQEKEMSLRLPASITTVKLLMILPEEELAIRLPPVLLDVCTTLKSKAQDSRDTARKTLNELSLLLGPVYFGYILKELRNVLARGYQLHVLSFTVHSMLVYTTDHFKQGDLDYCLKDLVAVVMDDTFGTVGQEKDAEGYTSKMVEVKSSKSYDSMELLAKISTISQLSNLIKPLQALLGEKLNSSLVKKLDELMRRIGIGLLRNPDAESRDLLVFCYEVIKESYRANAPEETQAAPKSRSEERFLVRLQGAKRGDNRGTTSSHVYKLTRFSLDVLRAILNKFNSLLTASNLSGFIPIIGDSLVQAQEEVKVSALRLLSTIIKLPLREIDENSHVYFTEAVKLVKESPSTNSEAAQASLKLISSMLRERKDTKLRDGHLAYLLKRLASDIEEPDRQGVTFNFIRAVMSRKLVVPEMYELMDQIATMMVTNQTRSARDLARGTYVHFLVEYPQAKSRWTKQLAFFSKNLDYKHQSGRQSVMEAMHTLLSKTGQELAQDIISTFFLPIVLAMANDESPECRELAGTLLGEFYNRADREQMKTMLTPLRSWLEQTDNMALCSIGLQAMRIYFESEQTEKDKQARFVIGILPDLMQPVLDDTENGNWEALYFALQLFTKLCKTTPTLALSPECATIWSSVQESLFFPHTWVKTCAANVVGLWMADLAKTNAAEGYASIPLVGSSGLGMDETTMLRLLRAGLRSLRTPGITEELAMQNVRNTVFLGRCCSQNGLELPKLESEDVESEDEDADSDAEEEEAKDEIKVEANRSAIHYIFKQISSLLRRETIGGRVQALIPKTSSITLLAALIRHVDVDQIRPSLRVILIPLQHLTDPSIPAPRSSDETFQNTYKSLVSNCHEVLDLLQKKLGPSEYIEQISRVQAAIKERREGRRAKRRIDAVADPEKYGREKMKKNERKRDKRREKGLEHRGKRRGW
ncbi:Down-regulated-in-metastasis protein [Penicillium brevicompactum]|uniref:uncharacterized protein n=1 Tax=Penicillium brevicompactum TaxID=5074 RepID=UPI00253FA60A|nr:uncharacterized protein N7506_003718 [Penicillium brevicompactum]KAJ5343894.1 hypothetical protein N7506_003718 [Penicillium brevicompactum]